MIEKIKEDLYNNWITIILIIVYLIFMQIIFSTWCPIKAIFNVECPGCGLTHATIFILQGQFENAFKANYTVFLWWPLLCVLFIDRYIYKFKKNIILIFFIIVCLITVLRYIINFYI